jgi:hypothetical protein
MPKLRHPVSGAIYDLEADGLIRVETKDGKVGWFHRDASWSKGELREADPHVIGWLSSQRLPNVRRPVPSPERTG